ncbi:MAG TPA: pilus assembly protein TadG-related protein [Anaerolineales bacterium]
MKKLTHHPSEKGQSLVFMVVAMIAFLGFLAFVIDGGNAYSMKRSAQNAADAGALAGATTLCNSQDTRDPAAVATTYAVNNHADPSPLVTVDTANKTVSVRTQIVFRTFFAWAIGMNQMTASAFAEAGCYSPGYGDGVLPVAWSCKFPVLGIPPEGNVCSNLQITWERLQEILAQTPPRVNDGLYIVMDDFTYNSTTPADFYCKETSPSGQGIVCDLNGDGQPDFFSSGGRSWLDLDGKGSDPRNPVGCDTTSSEGSVELDDWILNGFRCDLTTHTWVGEQTGLAASIYTNVETRRRTNPLVIVPVFDELCNQANPQTGCPTAWHAQDKVNWLAPMYFHINGFAALYITCVNQGLIKDFGDPASNPGVCPGIRTFVYNNRNSGVFPKNVNIKSIEGYFLKGVIPGLGGKGGSGGLDTGVNTIYLNH